MNCVPVYLRPMVYAFTGFTLWVGADTLMKLAGEAALPPYEVVGFMGFFAALSLAVVYGARGQIRALWPQKPAQQLPRILLAFGCVVANAFALKHLPLTIFYIVVFTSPMMIAVLAALFLRENLGFVRLAAIVVGFLGVIIAIDPWNSFGHGDWFGYGMAFLSALFFAIATVLLRVMAKLESLPSIMFLTAFVEAILGLGLMAFHAVPVPWPVVGILALMGCVNVTGNIMNGLALRHTDAATVEQFHYSQIVIGALLGYSIWHDVPNWHVYLGAAVIIASGLYVVASAHYAEKRPSAAKIEI